jgi:hypothetical protein
VTFYGTDHDNPPTPDPHQPYPSSLEDADDQFEAQLKHHRLVTREVENLRVRDDARLRFAAERAGELVLPDLIPLDEFLARPLPSATHLVDTLWPRGGNVILAAQWKAGKTTLRDNLLRALVDAEPFLGRFATHADDDGRLSLMDVELDERTLQRWLTEQRFQHPERVSVVALRGRAATFNILDDRTRARWASLLRDAGITRLALDCLRPVLDALGLDEHREAGRFLEALDALGADAGLTEKFIVHHMGHGSERARGDSRLLDWPDAAWKLTRLKTDDDPTLDDPSGPRFLSAFGRDVNLAEVELTFDDSTRHLMIGAAAGNRTQARSRAKVDAILPDVLAAIRESPGVSTRGLREACKGARAADVDAAAKVLRECGRIVVIRGARGHEHTAVDLTVSAVSHGVPDAADTRVRVSIDTDTVHTPKGLPGDGTRDTPDHQPRHEQSTPDAATHGQQVCPLHRDDPRPDACFTCAHGAAS